MNQSQQAAQQKKVSLFTIFLVFLKVGAFTFGGGYAMLPIIQREIVTRRKWIEENLFFDMLIVAQSLPGAVALNSAIQVGLRLRGFAGGSLAALGVIIPSFCIIYAIAAFFLPHFQDNAYIKALFYGLRPAVVALIAAAVINLGRSILDHRRSIALAAVLLAAALLLKIHPVFVLIAGGLAGLILFQEKAD
ncbi:MAG TPA: chromate transporter [Bacillota bacterium]|nr:chromate transporter [Bacillota bacterium]HOA35862.1 chromate transporter [Bacillota bacterium]HOJ84531.1 chromate transporter [Bacillota bacterium]HOL16235.1 chromate transporter [Bacillota bacterium]HPZ12028.1 chromate transporter [Bacillota bacterium]